MLHKNKTCLDLNKTDYRFKILLGKILIAMVILKQKFRVTAKKSQK